MTVAQDLTLFHIQQENIEAQQAVWQEYAIELADRVVLYVQHRVGDGDDCYYEDITVPSAYMKVVWNADTECLEVAFDDRLSMFLNRKLHAIVDKQVMEHYKGEMP